MPCGGALDLALSWVADVHAELLESVVAERSPIFSAKNGSRQIGYIEGNEAFDLLGRWRCRFNEKTGNLCDPNGKIVGHLSLERKFVGVSWIADELFPKPDAASIEASINSPGEPIALDPTETSSLSDHDAVIERALEAIRIALAKKSKDHQ